MNLNELGTLITPDHQATQRLTGEIQQRNSRTTPSFAGCDCADCILIGEHLADWLTPELNRFLNDLGLDPTSPVESWSAGVPGQERATIALEFIAVGQASTAKANVPPWQLSVRPGNQTPFPGLTEAIPWTASVDLYSLCLYLDLDRNLRPIT